MPEKNIDIAPLFLKHLDNLLSAGEHERLMQWVNASDANRKLFQDLQDAENMREYLEQYLLIDPQAAFNNWKSERAGDHRKAAKDQAFIPSIHRIHFLKTAWFRYAAVLLLLLGAGAYFWFFHNNRSQTLVSNNKRLAMEIKPGKEGAVLTLADGSQVVLDSLGNGVIAAQNGSRVVLKNGQLAYDPTGKAAGDMVYNTMTTPKGRQFSVVLPDGTRVWLNAASSLRYPTAFSGRERQVMITGEAYFEVAKDKAKPFFVKINDAAMVEVLGTSFNVNAYEDEASINTTLLEGSVRVQAAASTDSSVVSSERLQYNPDQAAAILRPGQQAQIINALAGRKAQAGADRQPSSLPIIKVVNNADIDKVMAWKNGAFNFQDASLQEVMRQLERWYDIQVVYEKDIPDIHFVGEMSRDIDLAGLIRVLEGSEVHFRLEGRRLVVLP